MKIRGINVSDLIVVLDALAKLPGNPDTIAIKNHAKTHFPNSQVATLSNSQTGRLLSQMSKNLGFLAKVGSPTKGGQPWQRTLPVQIVQVVFLLYQRGYLDKLVELLQDYLTKREARSTKESEPVVLKPATKKRARKAIGPDSAAPSWADRSMQVSSDDKRRAAYRLLQSWYRETELHVPPGRNADGRLVGSMLDFDTVLADPSLNYLSPSIAAYVEERVPEIQMVGGTVDVDRLRRNMLSSQPLCFNLFGALREEPAVAAEVLSDVLDLYIDEVVEITVEHAPLPTSAHLGDRTAFDAFIEYRTATGERGFVGVETKYTEPFSTRVYSADDNSRYAQVSTPEYGFREGSAGKMAKKSVNQLWRNALLAASLRAVDNFDFGHVAVLACDGDPAVTRGLKGLEAELLEPADTVRSASFEHLVARAGRHDELVDWAAAFRRRYLELAPVQAQ